MSLADCKSAIQQTTSLRYTREPSFRSRCGGVAVGDCASNDSEKFEVSGFKFQVSDGRSGFTLIELILVMTILTVAVSLTAPALANFFRGRTLDSEARRLLAATRQAQSRAAAEGLPVELWFDSSQNKFGIEAEPSYETVDPKAEEFPMDANIQLNVTTLNIGASRANGSFGSSGSAVSIQNSVPSQTRHAGLPHIRFMPDGTISEDSPQIVQLIAADQSSIWMMLSRSRLNYELQARPN